jgi:hypothetical protein
MILSVALVSLLPACATVTRGTSQAFQVESEPPGADVTFVEAQVLDKKGKPKKPQQKFQPASCKTPCAIKAKRKPGFTVKISKDGYEPIEANVASGISGAGGAGMAGNVLVGGLVGAVVDGSSGAMNELRPNPLKVTSVKIQPPAPPAEATAAPAEAPAAPTAPAESATPTPTTPDPASAASAATPTAPATAPVAATPPAPTPK